MIRTIGQTEKYLPIQKIDEKTYIVCCDCEELGEPGMASWAYEYLTFKPSLQYVKDMVLKYHNDKIDEKILTGFTWNGMPIWLSSENQFNYKAAYDLAVQTNGESLPVTFKFGTIENPIYYTFTNMEEFKQFYIAAITFINTTLADGWVKKDSIDWSVYEINE